MAKSRIQEDVIKARYRVYTSRLLLPGTAVYGSGGVYCVMDKGVGQHCEIVHKTQDRISNRNKLLKKMCIQEARSYYPDFDYTNCSARLHSSSSQGAYYYSKHLSYTCPASNCQNCSVLLGGQGHAGFESSMECDEHYSHTTTATEATLFSTTIKPPLATTGTSFKGKKGLHRGDKKWIWILFGHLLRMPTGPII